MTSETPSREPLYYGWIIVAACFLIVGVSAVVRNSFGLFFKPILAEFGLSRAALSLPVSFSLLLFGIAQPIGGHLAGRYGARAVIGLGALLTGAAILGMSRIESVWGIYLFYGILLAAGGAGTGSAAILSLVASWFRRRSGFAISLAYSGSSIGQLVGLPLIAFLLGAVAWRRAFLAVGAVYLLITLPICLGMIRNRPGEDGADATGEGRPGTGEKRPYTYGLTWRKAVWTAPFLLLLASSITAGCTVMVMAVHWVPFATDVGFSATTAATAFAVGSGSSLFCVLLTGFFSDRIGRKVPLGAVYFLRGLAFLLFFLVKNDFTLWATPVLVGFIWFTGGALTSALTADFYGSRSVGVLFGLMTMVYQLGSAVGVWLAGFIHDATGSYDSAFFVTMLFCFLAGSLVWLVNEKEVRGGPAGGGSG